MADSAAGRKLSALLGRAPSAPLLPFLQSDVEKPELKVEFSIDPPPNDRAYFLPGEALTCRLVAVEGGFPSKSLTDYSYVSLCRYGTDSVECLASASNVSDNADSASKQGKDCVHHVYPYDKDVLVSAEGSGAMALSFRLPTAKRFGKTLVVRGDGRGGVPVGASRFTLRFMFQVRRG
jgi:hypothetical protein